jgi:phosphonatase-like hydrolase
VPCPTHPSIPIAEKENPVTPTPTIRLAVLDMAGTTVADDGLVDASFRAAAADAGVPAGSDRDTDLWNHVRATMGQSKIEVFRAVFDEDAAQRANQVFERTYSELVAAGRATALPGALATIRALRDAGVAVALTTGFSRETQHRLLEALGWHDVADLVLCPADAGRGRPYPDLALTALLRLPAEARPDDVAQVAVVGDTSSDILTGRRAGASVVAGVLTGAHDEATLRAAGATHVLGSVTELPALLVPASRTTSASASAP